MNWDNLPDLDEALDGPSSTLATGTLQLLKTAEDDDVYKFAGIASDDSEDVDGDKILRKHLDISYAADRGFVNYDHSRKAEDQIGYLTSVEILDEARIKSLRDELGVPIKDSATVYVEGQLYKHVERAKSVIGILRSAPKGKGLGLSLDGVAARAKKGEGAIVKAYIRGVAITPVPAHPNTMCQLIKSLRQSDLSHTRKAQAEQLAPEQIEEIAAAVGRVLLKSESAGKEQKALSRDDAVMFILKSRPKWTYELAKRVVDYTAAHSEEK
jgi:hypothetical protein